MSKQFTDKQDGMEAAVKKLKEKLKKDRNKVNTALASLKNKARMKSFDCESMIQFNKASDKIYEMEKK